MHARKIPVWDHPETHTMPKLCIVAENTSTRGERVPPKRKADSWTEEGKQPSKMRRRAAASSKDTEAEESSGRTLRKRPPRGLMTDVEEFIMSSDQDSFSQTPKLASVSDLTCFMTHILHNH